MKYYLFCLIVLIPVFSFAQSNFQKGYILTNKKDTLSGYVNYKESTYTPKDVLFKTKLTEKSQLYKVTDIAGYGVNQQVAYERYSVNISSSSISVSNLNWGVDSSYVRDTVFLTVLEAGKNLTLFSYRDEVKTRFYIKEINSLEPSELINQVYLGKIENNGAQVESIIRQKTYTRQLRILMDQYNVGSLKEKENLKRLVYGSNDLIKVVALINGHQTIKSTASPIRIFAGGGLNIGNAYYSGNNDLGNDAAVSKRSYLPMLTTGIDIFANPAIGKFIYRIELSLFMATGDISTTTPSIASAALSHSFDQYTVALTPQIVYNFYNTNRIKVFGGGGLGFNMSSYKNNKSSRYNSFRDETEVTVDEVDFVAFNVSFPIIAGVTLNRKIEFSIGYVAPASITNYLGYSINMQRFKIGINYLFGSH